MEKIGKMNKNHKNLSKKIVTDYYVGLVKLKNNELSLKENWDKVLKIFEEIKIKEEEQLWKDYQKFFSKLTSENGRK